MSKRFKPERKPGRTRRFRFKPLPGNELELAIEREFGSREAAFVSRIV